MSTIPVGSNGNTIFTSDVYTTIVPSPENIILGEGWTDISDNAFINNTKLTQITIPSSVTRIGASAFKKAAIALIEITIPSSVTSTSISIGESAFQDATALRQITIPPSVTSISIGASAFQNASALTQITIPSSVTITSIEANTFNATALRQITIPSSVTSIGASAFQNAKALSEITIPSSVTSIGASAFQDAEALSEITITTPSSLTTIGASAFKNAKVLDQITIPSSVTSIGESAFESATGLDVITITTPSSLTTIGANAFKNAKALDQITIPGSVTSIGENAFQGTTYLNNITVDSSNNNYSSDISGVLFDKNKFNLIQYPIGNTITSYTIPSTVTSIGANAFQNASYLYLITIPSSLNTIGASAFQNATALDQITIPSSVTSISIGASAFQDAKDLKQIIIPSSVTITSIEANTFQNATALTQITIPESVKSIGESAFENASTLTQITIPSSVTSIGASAFKDASALSQITIPASVKSIGANAFENASTLSQITIPASVTSIGANAFLGATLLNNITVDASNTNYSSDISGVLFDKNKMNLIRNPISNIITSYTIPSTVTSIGANSFIGAINLSQITIPASVTIIGDSAFEGIQNLHSVILAHDSKLKTIEKEAFHSTKLTSISIPSNVTNIGENAFQQSGLTNVYMRESTITALNANISFGSGKTFYGGTNVTIINYDMLSVFVSIDNSIKNIDISGQLTSSSYVNDISTNNIKYVNIGTKVTSINGEAFQNATALTQVIIPSTVTEIGSSAFQGASSLISINIPNSVTSIGSNAFKGASSLRSINIPNSVTTIGSNAFDGASQLRSITIPYEIDILNEGMFQAATSLSSVYFALDTTGSSKITSIGKNAFNNASFLSQITIPSTITSIGENAFKGTNALKTLYMWQFTILTLNDNDPSSNLLDGSGQTFYGSKPNDLTITTPSSTLFLQLEENNNKYIVKDINTGELTSDEYTTNITTSLLNYVNIGTNVTSIEANTFQNATALSQITIPSSVTSIGKNAFNGATALTQIIIPESVINIGEGAFQNATALSEIVIPSTVTSIGANAFQYDISLNNIIVESFNNNYSSDISGVLFNKNKTNLIQYPIANTITSYAIPSGVTNIENYAFQGAVNLVNITIPASVTRIGSNSFQGASRLTSLIFQESANLSKLNVNVGPGNTFFGVSDVSVSIITQVFNGTGELTNTMTDLSGATSARIEGYTSIGSEAFKDKTALISVTFSSISTIKSIGSRAFYGTTNLPKFIMPSNLTTIGEEAFYGMTNLTEITFPSSINSIGTDAFKNTGLIKVNVRPTTIGILNAATPTPSPNLTDGSGNTFYGKENIFIDVIDRGDAVGSAIDIIRIFMSTDKNSYLNFHDISSNIIEYTTDLYIDYTVVLTISNNILNNVSEYNKKRLLNKIKTVCSTEFDININRIRVALDDSSNNIINVDVLKSNITESMVPICFPRGTRVTTDQGNVAIELLNPDIHTIRGKGIVAITQTRPIFEYIISIDKDALGKNIPNVKTEISKEHKVFYKGEMVKAKDLVELCSGVKKIPYNGETLYNVLMEKHDKMMVHNLICETLDPDNIMAKICRGKCSQNVKNKIYEELNAIIKTNNIPAYKKACDYLSANL